MWSRRPIQNPVTGSTSQVKELRAGHHDAFGNFVSATATVAGGTVTIPNRSLINQRAICPAVDTITVNGHAQAFNFPQTQGQERISTAETIRAFRMSLNTLGDGFIESLADQTLLNLASSQCSLEVGTGMENERPATQLDRLAGLCHVAKASAGR